MKVRLLYFAVLRDIIGDRESTMTLPAGANAADVWQRLRHDHAALAGYERPPMVAINAEYADAEAELLDGDELAFIPPVAGG